MEKNGIINLISEVLTPTGFKKKGIYWVLTSQELTKTVDLQKSQFGNYYYINYGYIINALPVTLSKRHIYKRITSLDNDERTRIDELLNLDKNIPDEIRTQELKNVLIKKLLHPMSIINTEADLLDMINKMSQGELNGVFLDVKKYFNLPLPEKSSNKGKHIINWPTN